MAYPLMPALHGYSINKRPTFATTVRTLRSGREVTKDQQILPLWEFELRYEILGDETQNQTPVAYFSGRDELQQILGLFAACGGEYGFFYFDDTSDNSRTEQPLGVGNGTQTTFRLLRSISFGDIEYTEPVGAINIDESITVFLNDVGISPLDWSISTDLMYLVFDDPVPSNFSIKISYSYYYLCRFIVNEAEFEEFLYNRWSQSGLRFRSLNLYPLGAADTYLTNPLDPPIPPEPGSAFTAWDVLDKDPLWVLSGSNLIATSGTASRAIAVRTVSGKTSGKFYVEITPTGITLGNTTITLTPIPGGWDSTFGVHCYANFNVYVNATPTAVSIGGWIGGDVISIALDLDNDLVWFRKNGGNWNGSALANPATSVGGIDISALALGGAWFIQAYTHFNNVTVYTGNFGSGGFDYTVPVGFAEGWPDSIFDSGATFDPSTILGGITLANGNYSAIGSTSTSAGLVRSAAGKSTGKFYFEFFINQENDGVVGVGLANASAGGTLGSGANGALIRPGAGSGSIIIDSVVLVSNASIAYVGGCIIGIAVDLDANLFWARVSHLNDVAAVIGNWNANGAANPATGTGGFDISALGATLYPAMAGINASALDVALSSRTVAKTPAPAGFTIGWAV